MMLAYNIQESPERDNSNDEAKVQNVIFAIALRWRCNNDDYDKMRIIYYKSCSRGRTKAM